MQEASYRLPRPLVLPNGGPRADLYNGGRKPSIAKLYVRGEPEVSKVQPPTVINELHIFVDVL